MVSYLITRQLWRIIIMQNNRLIHIIALYLAFLSVSSKSYGQADTSSPVSGRGKYALVAYMGGGIGYYAVNAATPASVTAKTNRLGFVGSIRILWHPDHLVRIGFETGHMNFYSYTFRDSVGNTGKTSVSGVPLLLVASMPLTKRWNVFAGAGFYNLTTKLDYFGKNDSHKLSVGWMMAASYIYPLSEKLGLATELKWMDANETVDASICLQLQLVWKLFTW